MKNKKILLSAVAVLVAIILLITGICINLNRNTTSVSISTSELARAMTYEKFEEGDEAVESTDNVKFSAFFLRDLDGDGYAEKIKGTCRPIGAEDTLYMEINVQTEGYLKDAKIEILGQNFYMQATLPKDEQLKDNYIGNNVKTIEFNQLNNGTQKLISGVVRSGDYSNASKKAEAIGKNINNLSRTDNKIKLTGTYVKTDGTEIEVYKEIDLVMDWYGTTKVAITGTSQTYTDLPSRIDEENGTIKLNFKVNTNETNQTLNLSKNYVSGTIPELNGYAATEVKMMNPISNNLTYDYESSTRTFTIERTATVGEDGNITTSVARNNTYELEVIYPIEAYQAVGEDTVSLKIPVYTYYEGYNNPNTEFTNPYRSIASANIVVNYSNPVEEGPKATSFTVTVGKNVYKPVSRYIVSKQKPLRIYNGTSEQEIEDIYTVRWYAYIGTEEQTTGITLRETKIGEAQVADSFIKTDSTEVSMEEITSNIGIYFTGAGNLLKEDGWIKVYDEETGDLIETFTKDNWNKYTSTNPYKYELPVKHIRIETSETNIEQGIYVYNIKELNDEYITKNFTKEEFDNLQYIKTTLNGYVNGEYRQTKTAQANYEVPFSIATIGLSKDTISTQVTEENAKITITTTKDETNNQLGWVDGSFLVKLPKEILAVEINEVTINSTNVDIITYEVIEKAEGKFIKVNTENKYDETQSYKITIDVDITPDPRLASSTQNIELYASNEETGEYYYKAEDIYDVNDNLNTEEIVNKTQVAIKLVSPSSLLTNQTVSEYDSKNSVVIAPQIAEITPRYAKVDNEKQTAKIGVQIKNNYASTISEVVILGKIPFEGNTTVVSGKDLSSEFTTKMLETGIEIPEELAGKITVYYSENETPDKDLTKEENGWIPAENISNWENVKTFLIDFEEEVLAQGVEYTFYYKVEIPEGVEFNKTAYSHHGVYFSLDTDQGKYRTQTEPNKLGLRIVEKFNLEIIKTQKGKDKTVAGATYAITEILEDGIVGITKTGVTNTEGTLIINNLYAVRTYEIQEIKTPNDYELNSDIIRFIGHVAEDGTLTIEKLEGTTKEEIEVTKNEGEKHKVTVQVEDEAKAKLKIIKKEQGTDIRVSYVKYKITGYGMPLNGRILTTNANGETSISGLKIGEEYTLEETKASGYYLADPITFKIVNNEGIYETQITSGTVLENTVTEENSLPIANLSIENEKIPTYTLEINKIKKVLETELTEEQTEEGTTEEKEITYLPGAKFKLYKDEKVIGEYTTDENGKITIENLYQYIDGKDEEATYTLKEVLAPDGYAKVKDITFKVQNTDGTLKLINTEGKEEKYTVEGTTVKLTIEDSPSFKLIKKDGETGELLSNIKFAIYNVDEGTVPATNSKGETIGTLETINGKEYYTVTTDANGILTIELPEGYYKAVEVQAPEKYEIDDSTYYFGIGGSREGKYIIKAESAKGIFSGILLNEEGITASMIKTSDGGYIIGGSFQSSITLENGEVIKDTSDRSVYYDAILVKYDEIGEVQWAKRIGGSIKESIEIIKETNDGGFIVGARFCSARVDLGNGITFDRTPMTGSGSVPRDGLIIKYDSYGEIEWAQKIGGSLTQSQVAVNITEIIETKDNGYFLVGSFSNLGINLGNGVTLTNNGSYDGMLIKYSESGKVEWAKSIGGTAKDSIDSIKETSDGGYIVGGNFNSTLIELENDYTLSGTGSSMGMIIKYNREGIVEWANASESSVKLIVEASDDSYIVAGSALVKYTLKGDVEWSKESGTINTMIELRDGGYVTAGSEITKYTSSGEIKWTKSVGNVKSVYETMDGGIETGEVTVAADLDKDVIITGDESSNLMFVKYKLVEVPEAIVRQAKAIGGSASDSIKSISGTRDGGYIVGGSFQSSTIDLGNGVTLTKKLSSTSYHDGMLIKYSVEGVVEWAKAIGGNYDDDIKSVAATTDGGYIVGGSFQSSTIDLGNGVTLTNNSRNTKYSDGMVIKYSAEGKVEWAKAIGGTGSDSISSVLETSDGGYIVGGSFASSAIDLGNGVTLTNSTNHIRGMLIKYSSTGEVEQAQAVGNYGDHIYSVRGTSDGGYIVGGSFASSAIDLGNGVTLIKNKGILANYRDGMLIKYSESGEVEWAKAIGGSDDDAIKSVAETTDGGYIVGGYFNSSTIDLGDGVTLAYNDGLDGMVIKYSASGEVEWAKSTEGSANNNIEVVETKAGGYIVGGRFGIMKYAEGGGLEWTKSAGNVNSIIEILEGVYIVGGEFSSSTIDLGKGVTLASNGGQDGMILKISEEMGAPEVQELTVENERKEFKITTDICEIDGIEGGTISGEDEDAYETVKYGDNTTKEIIMIPDEGYEIIKITVNGEEFKFTENEDGSYSMQLTNITEDKHVEVTYSLKDNKIIINKVDSETKVGLEGATFKLDQIEEREVPESTIGRLTDNGQEYIEPDLEKEVTDALGTLTDNGQAYNVTVDRDKEVTDVLGNLTNNGTYYFIEQDGKYVPTNSKTYQVANGGTAGKASTTANSYIEIDLTNKTGEYAVVVNANVSSQSSDYGYATITESTSAPAYSSSTGRFIYMSGTSTSVTIAKDYTSMALEGGKIYYLHLGYYKNYSTDTGKDQIEFNSIKVYEATCTRYNFVENEGKYESTNQGVSSTVANSYIPIDLTNKEGKYALIVNANVSSQSSDYGYATVTENTTRPTYNTTTGRFIYISGTTTSVTTPTDYQATLLDGGKVYYLHLGYYKNASGNSGDDKFTINSVKLYETKEVTYNFVENNGKYESTIQGRDSRIANSYIPIDLTNCKGTYNLIVNANISSASGDYGYVTITENTTRPAYNSSTGRLIYLTGTTTPTDYTTVLEGEKLYYLHLGYYKNASGSSGDDKFTVNSITITPNADDLYHTEITTNSEGKGITQIPFGKYAVTETVAPSGYELNENSVVIEFREDENHEFTFENNKLAKVMVHHYIKGTTTKVAEDDILQDKAGYPYITEPKLDIDNYDLEKDENGNYVIPVNATGQFIPGEQEVIYYYEQKAIPLTVHYYIEGTDTPVELTDGTTAESITGAGNTGEDYTTNPLENVSEKYELVEIPTNANGTYGEEEEIVTYYYRIKTYRITTRVEEKVETTVTGETSIVKGGYITGEGETAYEIVDYGESSTKQIAIIPVDDVHKVSKITINGIEQEFTENEDGTVVLALFENVTEDKEIVVTFERIPTKLIVHHYIEGTENKVLLSNGEEAQDEEYEKRYGENYETLSISRTNLDEHYKLSIVPDNHEGIVGDETIIVTYYYRLKEYDVELTKYKEETDFVLQGVSFELTEVLTGKIQEYTTDETGKILIKGFVLGQSYKIQEISTVEGYLLREEPTIFTTDIVEGKLKVKVLEGSFKETEAEIIVENADSDNPFVKVSLENEPILTLIKKGNKGENLLPGAKFVIKELVEVNGETVEKDATDYYGNLIGTEEEINGGFARTVTTDENGEINEPLKAGKYKITEIQAPENYAIGEQRTYYFEVKKNQPRIYEINKTWEGEFYYNRSYIIKLESGDYISIYNIDPILTIPAEDTIDNQEISLKGVDSSMDIAIIRYNSNLKVKSVNQIGQDGGDWAGGIVATDDGGYVITGEITGEVSIENGEVKVTTENGYYDGAVTIKYDSQGKAEWVTKIDPTDEDSYIYNWMIQENSEGNLIVVGYADSETTIPAEKTENNEAITLQSGCYVAEITKQGKIKWVYVDSDNYYYWDYTTIKELKSGNYLVSPDPYENSEYFEISSADGSIIRTYDYSNVWDTFDFDALDIYDAELTNDGGIICVGEIWESQTIGAEYTAKGEAIELDTNGKDYVGLVVKFNNEFKVEWAHTLNGKSSHGQVITKDNGEYMVLGVYSENLIIPENETANNETINLETDGKNSLIINYNNQGKIQYANGVITDNAWGYMIQITEEEYMVDYDGETQMLFKETRQEATKAEKVELEVINTYNGPENEIENTLEKTGTDKVTSKDTKVYYEVKYNGTIDYFLGNAKITLVDTLPYPIIAEESELAGGVYNTETNTITWVEEFKDINTFQTGEAKNITITKILNLKYDYGNINDITVKMENKVNSRLELLEPNEENPEEYVVVKEDAQEAVVETMVEIPTEIIVHHYIYDAETGEYTTVKLVEDEVIEGIIGQEYTTTPSENVSKNYSPVSTTPENYEGKMTEEVIEINYYYQLVIPTVENNMNKVGTANKDANGVAILTKEDGEVTYNIKYNVKIKDYIGKAEVEIVDTLPAEIDITKSDIAGGSYDETTKTITWKETLEGIDTYANGVYSNNITKEIKLVYVNQDVTNYIVNTVDGNVKVYYPENHTTKPGEEQVSNTARDNEAVGQEYRVNIKVEKVWEDNENLKGKRPESVTIEIQGENTITRVLNAENGWMCEITGLPKYEGNGNLIVYKVTEKETQVNDLEYYEEPVITEVETQTEEVTNHVFTVENAFKLMETDLSAEITKEGSQEITSSTEEVEYTINFKAEVTDYIGEGKVKIVDTLPYKIDEERSSLAEGIYDDETQTITWEEELGHINTDVTGESYKVDITKEIRVVYKEIDLTLEKMTNKVNGKVELYETEVKDEKETSFDTNINVDGKVIVRYVDKDTGKDIDPNYNYEIVRKVGDRYETTRKDFENYEYIESTNNETGIIVEGTQEVIYYYTRIKTSVLVKYQDIEGNELATDVLIEGQVGDAYITEAKEIENYRFVEVIGNKEGIMTKEQIIVIYVYEKIPAKVIVKHLERIIIEVEGEEARVEEKDILPEETIEGYAGDNYTTERKVIVNYKASEPEPENKTGKMTEETIEVKYYYEKVPSGIITVKYVDINTGEEIIYKETKEDGTEEEKTYRYEITGYIGDEYETELKEIPYYTYVSSTENTTGKLTENSDTVVYYYIKSSFNFSVEKTITEINFNGEITKLSDSKLTKVEIPTAKVPETNLIISYKIKVKNDGEVKGKARIAEIIPKGYKIIERAEYWREENGVLLTEVELGAGEERELIVKLRWINSEKNLGTGTNTIEIRELENGAGYEELTEADNQSTATVVVTIKTGETINNIAKGLLILSLAICLYMEILLIISIKKGPDIKEIKFLKKK